MDSLSREKIVKEYRIKVLALCVLLYGHNIHKFYLIVLLIILIWSLLHRRIQQPHQFAKQAIVEND